MPLILETIGITDRPHVPSSGDPHISDYKEWWHFNLIDDRSGLDMIVNLSLSGNIRSADEGQANLILLTQEPHLGWRGGLNIFDGLAAEVSPQDVSIALGSSRIDYQDNRYRLQLLHETDAISADLELFPVTEPLMVWKDTPIGSGHINWVIVPYLIARGTVSVEGRDYAVDDARAYHDHNWGRWRWGDNFGWDWGFCAAAADLGGMPLSLVYDRTVDRAGNRVVEHSLVLWHGERLLKFFGRHMLSMQRAGCYRGPVRKLPGVAALMDSAHVATIPGRVDLLALDGTDRLEASYIPDSAIQIAIPRETGFGLVQLNETLGWLTIAGQIDGLSFAVTRRACFEFVG